MNGNSTRRVAVEPGGTGVVAHVGLHALGSFADRLGLGDALSSRIAWAGNGIAVHDRGKVLVQMVLVLAGGGESCLDIEHLHTGPDLFGSVPSDTTVTRAFHEITPETRAALLEAIAEVREQVWGRLAAAQGTDPHRAHHRRVAHDGGAGRGLPPPGVAHLSRRSDSAETTPA